MTASAMLVLNAAVEERVLLLDGALFELVEWLRQARAARWCKPSTPRLEQLISEERMVQFEQVAEAARAIPSRLLRSPRELDPRLVGAWPRCCRRCSTYARQGGRRCALARDRGDPAFFAITKRVYNGLYGDPGDGGELGELERRHYEQVLRRNADRLLALIRPGDVVLLRGRSRPGSAAPTKRAGARVVALPLSRRTGPTSGPNAPGVPAPLPRRRRGDRRLACRLRTTLGRRRARPCDSALDRPVLGQERAGVRGATCAWLCATSACSPAEFAARGSVHPPRRLARQVGRRVDVLQTSPPAPADAPLVVQVSRWDRMKDMAGVMAGFGHHVDPSLGAHLLLCGPAVTSVADDLKPRRYRTVHAHLAAAAPRDEGRVHLACTPMADPDEAAAIVNVIQRHASVVVQKSLAEALGSRSPKRCGRSGRSSPVRWAASSTRSTTASTASSQIPLTCRHSGLPSERSSAMPAKQRGSP